MNRSLRPREEDPYQVALEYMRTHHAVVVLAAVITFWIFITVFIWVTVDAAHMAGVGSYGG